MESDFFQSSRKISEDFLQTAVWIDDRAFEQVQTPAPEKLQAPLSRRNKPIPTEQQDQPEGGKSENDKPETSHSADPKPVIDGFAAKNIFCSVLGPHKDNIANIEDSAYQLALAADIIIVDWSFDKDMGEHALAFISGIIGHSLEKKPGQLRLIIVYTGSPKLADISKKIHETVTSVSSAPWESRDDGFCYVSNGIRIVVLAKEGTLHLPAQYNNRKTSFADLAQRSVAEFTKMTAGLVPNVVLYSMAQLRENTHKLLRKFNKELDTPYLTHRACLPDPGDAETHLVTLVASEIHSILEEFDAGKQVNIDSVRRWLQSESAPEKFCFNEGKDLDSEDVDFLLTHGFEKWKGRNKGQLSNKVKEKAFTRFTQMFSGRKEGDHDLAYSELNNFKSLYGNSLPNLTLGTLLQCDDSYFLCIHPLCDCVRLLGKPRGFIFLKLSQSTIKYNLVVKSFDGQYLKFNVDPKTKDCRIIRFPPMPVGGEDVKAEFKDELIQFVDCDGHTYLWIGELRHDSAQKYSNKFAAVLSRVGTNDYEWLRLIGEGKG